MCTSMLYGQGPKFGDVEKEDLTQLTCTYDSLANAEYIYHGCKIVYEYRESVGFEMVYYFHDRIKIYSDDALDRADYSIVYFAGKDVDSDEKISNLDAYTFNMEGNEITKTKLDSDNVYENEINKSLTEIKFAMPAVKAGSVIDVRYTLRSLGIFKIDEFYFQDDIPIREAHYEAEYPEYFNYNFNLKGLADLEQENNEGSGNARISFFVEGARSLRKTKEYQNLNFSTRIKTYEGKHIPAVLDEPFVYTMDNYRSSVKGELLSTQFPGSSLQYYTKTWDDIAELLDNSQEFGGQLGKNYKKLDAILESVSEIDTIGKIARIFQYVQNSYVRRGRLSIYTDEGIDDMIKSGSGNIAEINLLLVNLLTKAGIEAYPLVSSAAENGFLNLFNPSITDLNYVKVLVIHNQEAIYLDASDKHTTANILPYRSLGMKGVIIDGKNGRALDFVNPNKSKKSRIFDLKIENAVLKGGYVSVAKDYAAYEQRNKYTTDADLVTSLQKDEIITYTKVKIENLGNNSEDLKVTADTEIQKAIQSIDGKLFIDINIANTDFSNPFKSENRNYSIFFPCTINDTDMIKIQIPEGYEVEAVPENLVITTPNGLMKMSVTISLIGEGITILARQSTTKDIISPEYYESVKILYDQVEAKLKEKIVLSKV